MDKSMMIGLAGGAIAATAVGGIAGYEVLHSAQDYAKVVSVRKVSREIRIPHQVCAQQAVTREAPVEDKSRIAGTAVGALLGGVLGNQIGNGSGRTLATIAGAAAGGYAGNEVQGNMQRSDRQTVMETRCRTEYTTENKLLGYDVTYRIGAKEGVVRMDHDPGPRIPVKDGSPVLSAAS